MVAHDEFSLIRQWTSRSDGQEKDGLTVGLGDDAAVFSPAPEMEVVACCDAMVETVHFLKETMSPSDIGYKAVTSNVSDVAAMGGYARYALVSIAVAPHWTPEECQSIYDGIYAACEAYNVRVIGGDTVSAPDALHLSVTVLGEVEKGRAIRRSQARPGQVVFVTGHVGSSAAGLHLLLRDGKATVESSGRWAKLIEAHQRPRAQVEAGRLLLESGACGALNDVSDGLASELWEIAEASAVSMCVDADKIPVREDVRAYALLSGQDPLKWAFYGGEDYQLVGTLEKSQVEAVRARFAAAGILLTVIGEVEEGKPAQPKLSLRSGDSRTDLPKAGYNHFRQRE